MNTARTGRCGRGGIDERAGAADGGVDVGGDAARWRGKGLDPTAQQVLEACVRIADGRFVRKHASVQPLFDAVGDARRKALELAVSSGGASGENAGTRHDAVVVFGMVARIARMRLAQARNGGSRQGENDEAFDAPLRRCQIDGEAPFPGVAAAQARGRALGASLGWLRHRAAGAQMVPEAIADLAGEAFSSETFAGCSQQLGEASALDAFTGAVETTAGAPYAVMGLLSCLVWVTDASHAWSPEALAWMLGGLRLCFPQDARGFISGNDGWEDEHYTLLRRGMVESAQQWSDDGIARFRKTLLLADATVAGFNTEVEQLGGRGSREWERIGFLDGDVHADLCNSVRTSIDMAQAARRLAAASDGAVTGGRRRRG